MSRETAPFLDMNVENRVNFTGNPGSYYPELYNKPHNVTGAVPGLDPGSPVPEWFSAPDRIEIDSPEYEIFVDFQKPASDRVRIQEIPKPKKVEIRSFEEIRNERLKNVTLCASGFIKGECSGGHRFARIMLCNKEFCPECGKKNSFAHKQRIARWWEKVLSMENVGYMVVTIPEQLRSTFQNKKILSEFRTYFKRKLQREGFSRGLSRYHWAGECESCKGKPEDGCADCNYTGFSDVWKPHLNFLIEGKFIPKEDLSRWREDLANYFRSRFKEILKDQQIEGNIYYNYGKSETYKIHKLKYVTRATWRYSDTYNYKEILDVIKGFRCSSTWGKFEKSDRKRKSKLVHLVNNECPCCKEPIKWGGFASMSDYLDGMKFNLFHIEAGYYRYQRIGEDPPPPDIAPGLGASPYRDPVEIPETLKKYYQKEFEF